MRPKRCAAADRVSRAWTARNGRDTIEILDGNNLILRAGEPDVSAQDVDRLLEVLLPHVQKPGRYTGGEHNQVVKDWASTPIRTALIFPDLYDLGMSNLGIAVLYDILNSCADVLCERSFAPWTDMEAQMRRAGLPLYSLESHHPLSEFDLLGFSIPYDQLHTNVLNVLDLSGIPLRAADRDERHPLVIAGGHATYNPEPMASFIDAFVIGEGEEVILEIIEVLRWARQTCARRSAVLERLARLWGVYVPAFYRPSYHQDGTLEGLERLWPGAPAIVLKRLVPKLPPAPVKLIVPYVDVVHNRFPVEIMRGCTRGCRFCQAGMITRPVRERSVAEILEALEAGLKHTGFEEIALLSLSSSDYREIQQLVASVSERFAGKHLRISLPSLRIETVSVELMEALRGHRTGGFTLAPEAATERMRNVINKPVSSEQLLSVSREIFARGWTTLKLYFMVGHPREELEDVQAIAELAKAVLAEGRKRAGRRAEVHVGVSTFIPKPHTPFQWVSMDSLERIEAKQALLMRELRDPGLKLSWTPIPESMLEAWLSRGDRRMGEVVYEAWKRGARFDAWQDCFQYEAWVEAFRFCGLEPTFYTHRERPLDEVFPWDHIDSAVRKRFLSQDYLWSFEGKPRVDCREQCFACGILPRFNDLRVDQAAEAWLCPVVKRRPGRTETLPASPVPAGEPREGRVSERPVARETA